MIKINEKICGFTVKNEYPVPELSATLYKMEYDKNGAELYFLDRKDENKTFSISFKTIPEDDTGVFHIIEHSVLCGSDKYPVKEPFVELLKGSLQTFLNAMTFPDKTMYPVATRNDKDFLNLISVYLDAVLHPAILSNPNIFRQEGWHYEINEKGELCRKGVVYNEMKGAYSSPDTVATQGIMRMLYPDTCYSYESGGSPEAIPNLTYEQFVASHAKYYHPSNSQIFIDGTVNLEETLSLIDSFLCDYDRLEVDFDIGEQGDIEEKTETVEYEIAPTEDEKDKTRISLGFLSTRYDEAEKNVALAIIFDAIASTNETALKKKIIESGLCDDFYIGSNDSMKRQFIGVNFVNVKDGKTEELIELFYSTLSEICENGIDKELLEASLNRYEFKLRERDFGTMPKGIIFAITIIGTALYGGDPTQDLRFDDCFLSLRNKLSLGYFEQVLKETVLDNKSRATLIMTPSKTLGEKREGEDRARLNEIFSKMSKEEIEKVKAIAKEVETWQATPDSEEALKTLPALTLDDIPTEIERIPTVVESLDETEIILHDVNTEGIVYTSLYFDLSDLTEKEICTLKLYTMLTKEVPTENYDVITLQKKIKANLGTLNFAIENFTRDGETKIYLNVSASALASKEDELYSLVREVLVSSDYNKRDVLLNVLRQSKISLEEFFVGAGHAAGIKRAGAAISVGAVVDEYCSGYEAYKFTKDIVENYEERADGVLSDIATLKNKILNRYRLILSITGPCGDSLKSKLVSVVNYGERVTPVCNIKPWGKRNEGIVIPAQIAYAAVSTNLALADKESDGAYFVARTLLSYQHLWNSVRVQGGAYGAGFVYAGSSLNISFYSYRDPTPARTLECYKQSSDFLRALAASGMDLTKFIIGAVGDTTPLLTPALMGKVADSRYLQGTTHESVERSREELLRTDANKLLEIADTLDKILSDAPICIVGGKDKLDECAFLDEILTL